MISTGEEVQLISRVLLLQFMWADHLRPLVPMVLMTASDVESYVGKALSHATAPDAAHMPGYTPLTALTPAKRLDLMADQGATAADASS